MRPIVPRVAAVHDLSGFGRVSLTMIIPILSTMGIQVCPIPTAVLSTHTGGFENYKLIDLTEHLEEYIKHWYTLGIEFDCTYTGFLGSPRQIDIISRFINDFYQKDQAAQFILSAIRASYVYQYPQRDGVLLEKVLGNLNLPVFTSTYEIF